MATSASRILGSVRPSGDGLVVPADVPSRAADLIIAADGLHVAHGGVMHRVPWEQPGIRFGYWERGKLTTTGLALEVPAAAEALQPTWTSLLSRGRFGRQRRIVPVIVDHGGSEVVDLFNVLVRFLQGRTEAQASLGDVARVERFAADLQAWTLEGPPRARIDPIRGDWIRAAIERAGYRHPSGRPAPPWNPDPMRVILERVRAEVAAIPNIEYRMISDDQVRKVIEVEYLGASPWPFGALVG